MRVPAKEEFIDHSRRYRVFCSSESVQPAHSWTSPPDLHKRRILWHFNVVYQQRHHHQVGGGGHQIEFFYVDSALID